MMAHIHVTDEPSLDDFIGVEIDDARFWHIYDSLYAFLNQSLPSHEFHGWAGFAQGVETQDWTDFPANTFNKIYTMLKDDSDIDDLLQLMRNDPRFDDSQ